MQQYKTVPFICKWRVNAQKYVILNLFIVFQIQNLFSMWFYKLLKSKNIPATQHSKES